MDRRRAQRQRPDDAPEVDARITAWLANVEAAHFPRGLDLTRFLRATADIPLHAGERLRRLGIAIELDNPGGLEPWEQWVAISGVYREALELSPNNAAILGSRSISALFCAQLLDEDDSHRPTLLRAALHASREAVACDAGDADAHYGLGQANYWSDPPALAEALLAFEHAVELDADHHWARLHLAHCLHDLERWREAWRAYDKVRLDAFDGPSGWRRELLREQRAYCMLRAGARTEAVAAFHDVMRRREEALSRGEDWLHSDVLLQYPHLLAEVAEGELAFELGDRARVLLARYETPLTEGDTPR
jgi:tetratricopeptide (TPR) repeat protein